MKNFSFVMIMMALIFPGCHTKIAVDSHDHGEEKSVYSAYTPGLELYAESDHFIAGQPSEILAHFTTLPDFKPLVKSAVTMYLTAGGQVVDQTVEVPEETGIYHFSLIPPVAGSGSIRFIIHYLKSDSIVEIGDIKVYQSEDAADGNKPESHTPKTNQVVFTKEQSWKTDFATAYPEKKPFGQTIKTVARVEPTQGAEMVISAKTNGMVIFSGRSLVPGTAVQKGQLLLSISGAGLAGDNIAVRFAEAGNNLTKAGSDYERIKELAKDRIVPEKELTGALNHYENCKALYEDLKASFTTSGQPVTSTLAGYIRQVLVKNGQYVEAGEALLVVSQDKSLILTADIQQKYLPLLSSGVTATVRSSIGNQVYTAEQLAGKVESVGRSINGNNFLLPVSVKINNTGGFIPGSLVEMWLKTTSAGDVLTVPVLALLEEQGTFFVFVQVSPELFEMREVKTGSTDGLETEIVSGVSGNERIVTKGAVMVKLAKTSGALDPHSGHVH